MVRCNMTSNREFLSDISKEKVEAVVQFVVVHLAIKGADMVRCNMTSSRKLGKSVESNEQEGGSQRDGENTLQESGQTNVPDLVSSSIVFNDQLSLITNTVDL